MHAACGARSWTEGMYCIWQRRFGLGSVLYAVPAPDQLCALASELVKIKRVCRALHAAHALCWPLLPCLALATSPALHCIQHALVPGLTLHVVCGPDLALHAERGLSRRARAACGALLDWLCTLVSGPVWSGLGGGSQHAGLAQQGTACSTGSNLHAAQAHAVGEWCGCAACSWTWCSGHCSWYRDWFWSNL